jgi:hypothetical protein
MKARSKKAGQGDTEHLLSIREFAEVLGKTYCAVKTAVRRGKFTTVVRFDKQEALKRGLHWRMDGGSGRCNTRPFVPISDPAIPAHIRQRYYETLPAIAPQSPDYPDPQRLISSIIGTIDAEIKHLSSLKRALEGKKRLLKGILARVSKE